MLPLDFLLSFFAPHHCLKCSKEGSLCCQNCLTSISRDKHKPLCYKCERKTTRKLNICPECRVDQHLDGVYWFSDYSEELSSKLIKSLKFDLIYEAHRPMASGISDLLQEASLLDQDLIVCAVPTANRRVRNRGWDQAKLVAKAVAKRQKLPYKTLLVRSSSFDQIGASKKDREESSRHFFKAHRKSLISGSIIVLVDDVLTTGSTLNSAARILKQAGAKEVYGVAFARQSRKK